VCWVPGFEEFKVPTALPSLLEGVGMSCRPVSSSEYGSYLIDYGKDVLAVLGWLSGLA
jgi:hypothetical protein